MIDEPIFIAASIALPSFQREVGLESELRGETSPPG